MPIISIQFDFLVFIMVLAFQDDFVHQQIIPYFQSPIFLPHPHLLYPHFGLHNVALHLQSQSCGIVFEQNQRNEGEGDVINEEACRRHPIF